VVGTKEAAQILAVSPPNFVRDWASRPDFPEPVATLSSRRLWEREAVESYRRRIGRRRAPRMSDLPVSPEARRWLPAIKRRIVRQFHPERIVLFGSQARGEAGTRSDIDLLVIVSEVESRRRLAADIYDALTGIPVATDVVVVTSDDIERYVDAVGTIVQPALEDGVLLYAAA
jgi:predicted nucleotidyltransferase